MTLTIRRVVTGHDERGRAVVLFDDRRTSPPSSRPGHEACVVWSSERDVADNDGGADAALTPVPTSLTEGSVFRIVEYGPGVAPRNHRTDSLDYAVVLSGSIEMELDDGLRVTLRQGDVLVQRGTIHNWVNPGPEPCRIAFVLIGATPVRAGGQMLTARG
jgi:quercetin dioxygenase-like cupin family protein